MIKAIVFDCFGVLVGGSLENFIDKYLSHDEILVQRAHDINGQACLGIISYEEQLSQFAELAEVGLEDIRHEMDDNPRNGRLLNYISEHLKGSYKISMLSNASDDWLSQLFTPEDLRLFDDFVLSYRVHSLNLTNGYMN
jgi:FMN phosphatase YigB (HAD superfamily)